MRILWNWLGTRQTQIFTRAENLERLPEWLMPLINYPIVCCYETKKILILGGYGGTGSMIARMVAQETDVAIIVAGRRLEKANEVVESLKKDFPKKQISARHVDATDKTSLQSALKDVDLLVVATTTPEYTGEIAKTALEMDVDYLDIMFDQRTPQILKGLEDKILKKKRIFITQAGFHPGLPAVFVRHAARYLDRYETAQLGMAMHARFAKPGSTIDLVHAAREYCVDLYKNGKWERATYTDIVSVDFGSGFGRRTCFPLHMEELKGLPERYGIKNCGLYVTGFNWFVDNLVFPLILVSHQIKKNSGTGLFSLLLYHGVNIFSSQELRVVFLIDASGEKDGKKCMIRIKAEHPDGFLFTAAPVVACIKQYLDGLINPGLHFMGHVVDTERLFTDMQKMGIMIEIRETKG